MKLFEKILFVFITLIWFVIQFDFHQVFAKPSVSQKTSTQSKNVAIIIDDLGNGLKGTDEILSIQAPLTVAIMPFLKTSKEDALRAHLAGFEVLLHIPLEPVRGNKRWLGPGAITTDMSDQDIKDQLRKEIESVPYVVGVNNHMGSKATADPRVVKDILEVLKEKKLFIVDSGTSEDSKIVPLAKQMGVPYVRRTVFLDNKNSESYIKRQIQILINRARNQGWGVGIGHVGVQGHNTYRAIQSMLTYINQNEVTIVPVSKIVKDTNEKQGMPAIPSGGISAQRDFRGRSPVLNGHRSLHLSQNNKNK